MFHKCQPFSGKLSLRIEPDKYRVFMHIFVKHILILIEELLQGFGV